MVITGCLKLRYINYFWENGGYLQISEIMIVIFSEELGDLGLSTANLGICCQSRFWVVTIIDAGQIYRPQR